MLEFNPFVAIIGMLFALPILVFIKVICDRNDLQDQKRVQRKMEKALDAQVKGTTL
jgi:predicted PurR-regulated permease PerM